MSVLHDSMSVCCCCCLVVCLCLLANNVSMGIVGLPNVGKSSFFNLLSDKSVAAENFPFCTIDPEQCKVPVPDSRFEHLVDCFNPKSVYVRCLVIGFAVLPSAVSCCDVMLTLALAFVCNEQSACCPDSDGHCWPHAGCLDWRWPWQRLPEPHCSCGWHFPRLPCIPRQGGHPRSRYSMHALALALLCCVVLGSMATVNLQPLFCGDGL